jgi:hypothetical protein
LHPLLTSPIPSHFKQKTKAQIYGAASDPEMTQTFIEKQLRFAVSVERKAGLPSSGIAPILHQIYTRHEEGNATHNFQTFVKFTPQGIT